MKVTMHTGLKNPTLFMVISIVSTLEGVIDSKVDMGLKPVQSEWKSRLLMEMMAM